MHSQKFQSLLGLFAKKIGTQGSLTVQFLLGLVLILSFISLFFMMTLTLAVSEVVQYITYSSSRQLFLSNTDERQQQFLARDKYKKLTTDKFKFKFTNNSLIQITKAEDMNATSNKNIGLNGNFTPEQQYPNLFYGVWTDFTPTLLSVNTLWGSTEPNNDPKTFFKTTIGSYLGREPSTKECKAFNRERWNKIEVKHGNTRGYGMRPDFSDPNSLQSDNGC